MVLKCKLIQQRSPVWCGILLQPCRNSAKKMAENEEVHYERERSHSRDRDDARDFNGDEGHGNQDDGSYRRERSDNGDSRRDEPEVFNLYVTNLSFQVQYSII